MKSAIQNPKSKIIEHPDCFGQLDTVFPMGEEGLRTSPPECMKCPFAKSCLQEAMRGPEGLKLQEEKVDLAYEHGLIGKLERWSRNQLIRQEIEALTSKRKSKSTQPRKM
ncbi:MAG: hypothetical protein KAT27_07885 [Desulfobacterales bacterium]|nr:hypothetical protein [Desulfobacterales bacterium]